MGRRSRIGVATAVVALLVVVAGCNGPGVGDRGEYDVPPRTATPEATTPGTAGTPTGDGSAGAPAGGTTVEPVGEPPDPGSGRLMIGQRERAPGVTDTAVRDPGRLAAAHRTTLSNRSFRLRLNHTVRLANGSAWSVHTAAIVAENGSQQVVRRRTTGVDGGDARSRSIRDAVYRSEVGEGPGRPVAGDRSRAGGCAVTELPDPTFHRTVERVFRATGATAVWADRNDTAKTRIVATGVTPALVEPAATDVSNLSARAVVDSRGVVRYLRVSYRTRIGGTPATVATTLRVFDVGAAVPGRGILDSATDQSSSAGPDSCR